MNPKDILAEQLKKKHEMGYLTKVFDWISDSFKETLNVINS